MYASTLTFVLLKVEHRATGQQEVSTEEDEEEENTAEKEGSDTTDDMKNSVILVARRRWGMLLIVATPVKMYRVVVNFPWASLLHYTRYGGGFAALWRRQIDLQPSQPRVVIFSSSYASRCIWL